MSEEYRVPEEVRRQNRELCERYPFLIPRNRWSGKRITEAQDGGYWPGDPEAVPEPYDYEYTELDEMPDGWRKAFGLELCEELKQELLASGGEEALNDYMIVQIKEKYGMLRWYDNGCTERWFREILPKYEELSEKTCISCGKPAKFISNGWISPWCENCAKDIPDRMVPIEEWFRSDEGTEDGNSVKDVYNTADVREDFFGGTVEELI